MRNFLVLILGLLCLSAAALLGVLGTNEWSLGLFYRPETYHSFVEELGIALIIGFVVSVTIERASRREFNNVIEARVSDIQKQVFRATYGRNMSPKVIEEIERLIFEANFMRSEFKMIYDMKLLSAHTLDDSDPDIPDISIVQCDITSSYRVEKNISKVPQTYELRLNLEKPPFASLQKFIRINSISIDGQMLTASKVSDGETSSSNVHSFKKLIPMAPGGGAAN